MAATLKAPRRESAQDVSVFPKQRKSAEPVAEPVAGSPADICGTNLDFRVHDVQSFIDALQSDPYRIQGIVQDAALIIIRNGWTETASERLCAVARWCLRHYLTSKSSNEIVAVVGSSLTFCSQALRSADLLASARLGSLAEVLDEHLRARSVATPERVLKMAHVPEILSACASISSDVKNHGKIARKKLMAQVNLGQGNLTRIMGWLVEAGLVEQALTGREVVYRLTHVYWTSTTCNEMRRTESGGSRGKR